MLVKFWRVAKKTKSGLRLYLKAEEGNICLWNEEGFIYSWDKDCANACWFETKKDAQDCCKKYSIENYEIEDFSITQYKFSLKRKGE